MLEIKMTTEFFEDLFTSGALTPRICIRGLPENAKFIGIGTKMENGATIIVAHFNDRKLEITRQHLTYTTAGITGIPYDKQI